MQLNKSQNIEFPGTGTSPAVLMETVGLVMSSQARNNMDGKASPKYHNEALDDALELRLVDALEKESSLDQCELSRILCVSRATVQRCFKRLLEAGKIVRIVGKRFGHWEVIG